MYITSISFEFCLVHCVVCVCCHWSELFTSVLVLWHSIENCSCLKLSHTFAQLMKQASTQLQMSYVSHWIQHQYHKIQMVLWQFRKLRNIINQKSYMRMWFLCDRSRCEPKFALLTAYGLDNIRIKIQSFLPAEAVSLSARDQTVD